MDNNQKQLQQKSLKDKSLNGFEVEKTISSDGFKILLARLNDRISDLEQRMITTIDPNEAMACIKEKNGLLFILEISREIVETGKDAANQLAVV